MIDTKFSGKPNRSRIYYNKDLSTVSKSFAGLQSTGMEPYLSLLELVKTLKASAISPTALAIRTRFDILNRYIHSSKLFIVKRYCIPIQVIFFTGAGVMLTGPKLMSSVAITTSIAQRAGTIARTILHVPQLRNPGRIT